LVDHGLEIGHVAGEAAQRKRRREQRVLAAIEQVEHSAPARGVSERAVDENDRWLGHENSFRAVGLGVWFSGALAGAASAAWVFRAAIQASNSICSFRPRPSHGIPMPRTAPATIAT